MSQPRSALRSYDRVAPIYDGLARLWTGGGIAGASAALAPLLRCGDRVLMAGVGGGRDAARFAALGARLTLVDLSPAMLSRATRRVQRAAPDGAPIAIQRDVRALHDGDFDGVCAHYFLNLFAAAEAERTLRHLATLLRPGGLLSIADFAPLRSGAVLQRLHYGLPSFVFCGLGLAAPHPIHDYGPMLVSAGLEPVQETGVPVFGVGPRWHRSWIARRPVC